MAPDKIKDVTLTYTPVLRTFNIAVDNYTSLSCAGAILKNQPVCYGTSRLKIWVCAVTRYALLKTPMLKSNKR